MLITQHFNTSSVSMMSCTLYVRPTFSLTTENFSLDIKKSKDAVNEPAYWIDIKISGIKLK